MATAGHMPADYIDPTKSLFPLGSYPQSVDKLLPPGLDRHVPVMDIAAQQRHFSDLKSRYFGMGAGEKSPWNPSYIGSVLSIGEEAARDISIQHQNAAVTGSPSSPRASWLFKVVCRVIPRPAAKAIK